ncbi:MAG: hypothetical protein MOB07_13725 [Acidobacteria bacterium]|nr:hypothetical protein [Acidobacteriota bacterium]
MATQLTFAEEYRYPDDPSGITIPVLLTYGQRTVAATAKVDTGGGVCLFSHEIGLKLNIPIEQGVPTVLDSLGGPIEAFAHEVTFQTCSLVFRNLVYFAKYPGLPRNVLGRQGWLQKLRMAVIDYDNLLYLNTYDS